MTRIYVFALAIIAFSCNNKANNTEKTTDSTTIIPPKPIETDSLKKDTVFSAFGNEPFWHVAIIENDKYIFHPMDGGDVIVPWVAATIVDSITTRYASSAGNNNIVLIVSKKKCSDGMSDIEHLYATDLTVNGTHYSGCGRQGK
jgi:uncharacterized membrane protein